MINKELGTTFLSDFLLGKKIRIQHFASGCVMVDVYLNQRELLCVQIEAEQIGVSIIKDYNTLVDLSSLPDSIFYSNSSFENYIRELPKAYNF